MSAATTPPPIAWYGGSFAYYDEDSTPPPSDADLDAAAGQARDERTANFTLDQFGPEPGGDGKVGVVLGRFLPVHDGHRYLIEFALAHVAELHIFVRVGDDDPIPFDVRRAWLLELFPGTAVTPVEGEREQWPERILAEVRPDYLFSGEPDGPGTAARLGAECIPVNRHLLLVSGTGIRKSPWDYERFLPPPVRAWYAARVCLIGAESTGKTTLAEGLARHYDTVWVPERLRELGPDITPATIALAARGQSAAEDLMARRAHRLVFTDTDLLAVRLWSMRLFGAAPPWLQTPEPAHLYLLCAPDRQFSGDIRRNTPAERLAFHEAIEAELVRLGRPYVTLEGDDDQRLTRAVAAVDDLRRQLWG
ncbi:AAA family ATPase [Dactylosporangium matsuzakiense]|uniref:AAA family ATPase n=1 Tax=Dactylosporangium matsuzakiense TaxID=53360 RepID=UPI0021C30786|nr:AAA family ATPase [Dactylosporangium matsuzakiense]UWZ48822.1 AAA family ATPase [Dactylosporangium matsuzakiense]